MKSKVLIITLILGLVVLGGSSVFAHEVDGKQQTKKQANMHDGMDMNMGMMNHGQQDGSNNHMQQMMKKCMKMMQQMKKHQNGNMNKVSPDKTKEKTEK